MERLHDARARKRSAMHIHPSAAKRRKCGVGSKLEVGARGSALGHRMIEATLAAQNQPIADEGRGQKTRKRRVSDENRQSKIARTSGIVKDVEQQRGLRIWRALRKLGTVKDAREAEIGGIHSLGNVNSPCLKADELLGKRKRCEGESEDPVTADNHSLDEEGLSHTNKKGRVCEFEQTQVGVLPSNGEPKRFLRCKNRTINTSDGKPDDREDMANFCFVNKGKKELGEMDSDVARRAKKEKLKHGDLSEVFINRRLKARRSSKGSKWSDNNHQSKGLASKTKRLLDPYVESAPRKRLKTTIEDERVQHEHSDDKLHLHADRSSQQQAGVASNVEYKKRLRKRYKREDAMRKRRRIDIDDTGICERLQHL